MSVGVGGGGILVPILNIILGLSIKESTTLSQAMIAAAGIGSAVYALTHPHPYLPWKPLIDFNLVLVIIPALLLGVSVGVLANVVSPDWAVTLVLLTALVYMCIRTWKQAKRLQILEKQARALEALRWSAEEAETGSDCMIMDGPPIGFSSLRPRTRPDIPWGQLFKVVILWAIFAAIQVSRSNLTRCTWMYAGLNSVQVLVAVFATIWFVRRTLEAAQDWTDESWELSPQVPLLEEDRMLFESSSQPDTAPITKRHLHLAAASAVGAGTVAGFIGMGGGFLLNPLLLEFGAHPQVAASTSSLLVLFSSAAATMAFITEGRLDGSLAMVFGTVCCASAFVGVYVLAKVVKKRGASAVVFLLAGVIAFGTVATAVFGSRKLWKDFSSGGKFPGLQPFCRVPSDDDNDGCWGL